VAIRRGSFGHLSSTTTATVRTGHSDCNRWRRLPGWPSLARMTRALCTDATSSAASYANTGELQERVCAPFTLPAGRRLFLATFLLAHGLATAAHLDLLRAFTRR
jgi:hypothetical protein